MRLGECDMWQIMFRYTKADKNPLNITTIFTIVRKEKKKPADSLLNDKWFDIVLVLYITQNQMAADQFKWRDLYAIA